MFNREKQILSRFIPASLRFFVLVITSIIPLSLAQAAPPTTACDPEYMDALESRAWLEAQREISQNQNLIFKPDSVLEYTCFKSYLSLFADGSWFSEEHDGVTGTPLSETFDFIKVFTTEYIAANFGHDYLGHRIGDVSEGSGCGVMNGVWELAKCMDFFDRENQDEFWDFQWYTSNDPRRLPTQCPGIIASPDLNQAFNGHSSLYTVENNPHLDGTLYEEDPVKLHLDKILYFGHTLANECYETPIKTGVTVQRNNFAPPSYPDAVCPNPGCYYTPNGKCTP